MLPRRIPNATRVLSAPPGWDEEVDGACGTLPICDVADGSVNIMYSYWEPTPDELERLSAGASLVLGVVGRAHPPVSIQVAALDPVD